MAPVVLAAVISEGLELASKYLTRQDGPPERHAGLKWTVTHRNTLYDGGGLEVLRREQQHPVLLRVDDGRDEERFRGAQPRSLLCGREGGEFCRRHCVSCRAG